MRLIDKPLRYERSPLALRLPKLSRIGRHRSVMVTQPSRYEQSELREKPEVLHDALPADGRTDAAAAHHDRIEVGDELIDSARAIDQQQELAHGLVLHRHAAMQ